MILSQIADRLCAGERLDAPTEAMMIAAVYGTTLRKFYVATGDSGGEELQIELESGKHVMFDPWPSRSIEAALNLVDDVAGDSHYDFDNMGLNEARYNCSLYVRQGGVRFFYDEPSIASAKTLAAACVAALCRAKARP